MRLVFVESPFAGDEARNRAYAWDAVRDCLARGEAPFAGHLFYTEVLDDGDPDQRAQGMEAGWAWAEKADATVVYTDLGISPGMRGGVRLAKMEGRLVEYRTLPGRAV